MESGRKWNLYADWKRQNMEIISGFFRRNREVILTLAVSVMANVVSYYICKWLDRKP